MQKSKRELNPIYNDSYRFLKEKFITRYHGQNSHRDVSLNELPNSTKNQQNKKEFSMSQCMNIQGNYNSDQLQFYGSMTGLEENSFVMSQPINEINKFANDMISSIAIKEQKKKNIRAMVKLHLVKQQSIQTQKQQRANLLNEINTKGKKHKKDINQLIFNFRTKKQQSSLSENEVDKLYLYKDVDHSLYCRDESVPLPTIFNKYISHSLNQSIYSPIQRNSANQYYQNSFEHSQRPKVRYEKTDYSLTDTQESPKMKDLNTLQLKTSTQSSEIQKIAVRILRRSTNNEKDRKVMIKMLQPLLNADKYKNISPKY